MMFSISVNLYSSPGMNLSHYTLKLILVQPPRIFNVSKANDARTYVGVHLILDGSYFYELEIFLNQDNQLCYAECVEIYSLWRCSNLL